MAKKPSRLPLNREKIVKDGRTENNLSEFPLATLSNRPTKEKRLVFEDQVYDSRRKTMINRKMTISTAGSHLPTAADKNVLMAVMQLTWSKNQFLEPKVAVTIYEIIKVLDKKRCGQTYEQIRESLRLWSMVHYHYENAWWDKAGQVWRTEQFHMLNNVSWPEEEGKFGCGIEPIRITWNELVVRSFQVGNSKPFNFQTYLEFKDPTSQRLYEFLDKRFLLKGLFVFDVFELAHEHLGISRNLTSPSLVKRAITKAIKELESKGFIKEVPVKERFLPTHLGGWQVKFEAGQGQPQLLGACDGEALFDSENDSDLVIETTATVVKTNAQQEPKANPTERTTTEVKPSPCPVAISPSTPVPSLPAIASELIARGVSESEAVRLASERDQAYLTQKIDEFDYRMGTSPPSNPGAYLATSIRNNYAAPSGYVNRAEREQKAREQAEQDATKARAESVALQTRRRECQTECILRVVAVDEKLKLGHEHLQNHPELWGEIDPKGPIARGMKLSAGSELIEKYLLDNGMEATAKRFGVGQTLKTQKCVEWGGKQCQVAGCQRRKGLTLEEVAELNKPREN